MRERLDTLLTEMLDGNVSRFVWLRQFEVGNNSAGTSRRLDRLEFLQALDMSSEILAGVPPHRVTHLRRQGERYFADGLRDITSDRRLAILTVCVVEWKAAIADAVIETHDRIVGKTWRDAKRLCDARIADARSSLQETLRSFKGLGAALLEAKGHGVSLDTATEAACGWVHLERMVATAAELTDTMAADVLTHVVHGYHRFRRYAPRMLRALDIHAAADDMVLDLYSRLPAVRITDLLQEVDNDVGFTEAFTHLRTGVPCKDRVGLLNVLLAEGLNLGLSKMAEATSSHDYFQLSRFSRWHIESDAIYRALAMVIAAQSELPMAANWGSGITASSDGQFFSAARQGEA